MWTPRPVEAKLPGMDRLEDCISFLTGKAAQQVSRRAREMLQPYGITPVQYAALSLLWERDGLSGAELGQRLVLDSATITGVVDRLEAAGLAARRPDPDGDRRINRIYLTARGRDLAEPLQSAMTAFNRLVAASLGDDASTVWAGLRKLSSEALDKAD